MTYDYICLTWTWSHEDTGWYLHSKNCKIPPSGPPSLSVASARIQFALGPVRWPFQHLDLGIWGREWGVMKEGVFFFVALQINICIWHFFIFFRMVHHREIIIGCFLFNHFWTIEKNHLFGLLGFCANFFTPNKTGAFHPIGPRSLPTHRSFDLRVSRAKPPPTQPPQGSLRHWTMLRPLLPTVWGIIRGYWLHFCNEHHFLGRFYQLHNSKSLITCSGPVLHMPSELGHQCIFCFWRHWWTLTWLMYHNASKWAHPSQKS